LLLLLFLFFFPGVLRLISSSKSVRSRLNFECSNSQDCFYGNKVRRNKGVA
jgi:hypothetical protein